MTTKKRSEKPIETLVSSHYKWWNDTFISIEKKDVKLWHVIFIFAFIVGSVTTMAWMISTDSVSKSNAAYAGPIYSGSFPLTINKTGIVPGQVTVPPVNGTIGLSSIFTGRRYTGFTRGVSNFYKNDVVTLAPIPKAGFYFAGWQGDCANNSSTTCQTGNNICVLEMNSAKTVDATFLPVPKVTSAYLYAYQHPGVVFKLSQTGQILGTSTVVHMGTYVSIDAVPNQGYTFVLWGGDCMPFGSSTRCNLYIDGDKKLDAKYGFLKPGPVMPVIGISTTSPTMSTYKVSFYATTTSASITMLNAGTSYISSNEYAGYFLGGSNLSFIPNLNSTSTQFIGWGGDCANTPVSSPCTFPSLDRDLLIYGYFR